ncbi:hypothetical protein HG530_009616 [Fusarium avenaceum]|nr:hypothetical protein HG530_009616 [Fusarium avenaceum]
MATDSTGNITEALEDSRLELVGKGGALNTRLSTDAVEDLEQDLHDAITLRNDLLVKAGNNGLEYSAQTVLHLLEGNPVLDTDNLVLQRYGLFKSLNDDVGERGNSLQAVRSSVLHKNVKNLIGSGSDRGVSISLEEAPKSPAKRSAKFIKAQQHEGAILALLCLRVNGLGASLGDSAQSVGSRVLDMERLIVHHGDEDRKSLLDDRIQDLLIGTLHDGTESGHRGISVMPVLIAQVSLHKRQHRGDDSRANSLGIELETLVSSAGQVVLVVGGILVLLGEELQENRHNLAGSDTGKVVERTHLIGGLDLSVVVLDGNFLFADSAPEFNSQLGNILVLGFHSKDITKGGNGSKANLDVRFLLSSTLHNSSQDGIGVCYQSHAQLWILALADVADGGQRRLLLVVGALAHILDEKR